MNFLLAHVTPSQTVYCIPFEHLLHFYKQCDFTNCSNFELVPPKIIDKYRWCQEKYVHPTALLVLEANSCKRTEAVIANEREQVMRDFGEVLLKKSTIGQFDDGIGAFANRDFKKREVVIKWNLKILSEEEYKTLCEYERVNFCHQRGGVHLLYPDPERHVNRFHNPNVIPDFKNKQM